jgi:Tfp pilus assembly protein PilO
VKDRRGQIIAGVVSVVLALIVAVALLMPRISAVGKRADDLSKARQTQGDLTNTLSQLKEARATAKRTRKQLAKLQTKIPPTADLPSLIRLLQNAADSSAVDFIQVSPGAPVASTTGLSLIPTQINVTGSFFSVEEFLFKLETLPRAVRVTQISVAQSGQTAGDLALQMTGEVYTTDASAGPGSDPGPTAPTPVAPVPAPSGTTAATS